MLNNYSLTTYDLFTVSKIMRRFLRKKVLISAAIWGKPYINEFINYNLSSMLSDNNLPASTKIADITFQFITTTEGKRTLLKKSFLAH